MDQLIARVKRTGSHFFDRDTMKFWNSRVLPSSLTRVDADRFRFITSEQAFDDEQRLYAVREARFQVDSDGAERVTIDRIGDRHASADLARAHKLDGLS
jgi:hypothetical protein